MEERIYASTIALNPPRAVARPSRREGSVIAIFLPRVSLVTAFFVFAVLSSQLTAQTNQAVQASPQRKVIVVVGAGGTPEYAEQFKLWSDKWQAAIDQANSATNSVTTTSTSEVAKSDSDAEAELKSDDSPNVTESIQFVRIGIGDGDTLTDADRLKKELTGSASIGSEPNNSINENLDELWIVLIGHGTYDRKAAKFNLRGPDVSAKELKGWLADLSCRIVLVNSASASGPFINEMAGKNRIVLTATKSGSQHNFARFGGYLAECIGDPTIDLDKDNQTSLLEAFLAASAMTQEFYLSDTRLATELALLDDNGDGLGTPADWFQGTRAVQKPKKGQADGLAANQVFLFANGEGAKLTREQTQKRNELEVHLEKLIDQKSRLTEEAYFEMLEPIMIKLAKIYEGSD